MLAALEATGAVLSGHFQLNSGRHSDRYIEKFQLLQWPEHTRAVCARMADAARPLGARTVVGPTTGGVILAYEVARQLGLRGIFAERDPGGGRSLQRGFTLAPDEPVLVVDDILTSGESVSDTLAAVRRAGGRPVAVAVMVDRSGGRLDFGVPLFATTEVTMQLYDPADCPLCRAGVSLTVT